MLSTLISTTALSALLSFTPQGLWETWPEERFVKTAAPCLRLDDLEHSLQNLAQRHGDSLRVQEVGRSFQGRPIYLMTVGQGPRKILLWSQMHGDEPSATPALLDLMEVPHRAFPTEADAVAWTAAFTRRIEDEIRRVPRDWTWMHDRWGAC